MQSNLILGVIITIMLIFLVHTHLWPMYVQKKKALLRRKNEEHLKKMIIEKYSDKEFLCVNEITDSSGPFGSINRRIFTKDTPQTEALLLNSFDYTIRAGSHIKLRPRTEEESLTSWNNDITRYLIPELISYSPFHVKDSDNFEFWGKLFEEVRDESKGKVILDGEALLISDSAAMNGQEGFIRGIFEQRGIKTVISCEYDGSCDSVDWLKFTSV